MRLLSLLFTLVTSVFSLSASGTHHVVSAERCQTMDGFGASDAWSFWQIGTWDEQVRKTAADWLFSLEEDENGKPKGIGLSIWRFNAGSGSASQGDSSMINRDTRTDRFDAQTGQRQFLRMAKERGVSTFIAFYNTPPVHLTQNGLGTNTGRGGTFNLRDDAYDAYAAYMADMVEQAEREDGIRFSYLCPVNEPDGHWNWIGPKQEGTPATNREIARITRALSSEFVRRGISTKILVNESSDYRCMYSTHQTDWRRGYAIQSFWNPDSSATYLGDLPNVPRLIAGHSYWTNTPVLTESDAMYENEGLYAYRKILADTLARYGTDFWMTELCIMGNDEEIHGGGGFDFSMEVALYVARVIHYDITVAKAKSWQWWRAAGGDYKDGLIRMYRQGERMRDGKNMRVAKENMVVDSKLMWTLGNYSRFVRPGAVRLSVSDDTDAKGVMVSAYHNTDGTVAVVAINYSSDDKPFTLELDKSLGVKKRQVKAYRTSDAEGENLKPVPVGKVLPKRSVTTFVYGKADVR